jgi:hypothetical protein
MIYIMQTKTESFEKKSEKYQIWLWNVLNCKDNSDGYLAYKRIKKQK